MITINELRARAMAHGHALGAVSVARLGEIKAEFDAIGVDTSPYYDFTPPQNARSVIIIAAYSPARMFMLSDGQQVNLPPGYAADTFETTVREYLSDVMIDAANKLPLKPLAAHSGIGRYGRNDVIYVDGMGSFIRLMAFYTALDCSNETYLPIMRMDTCATCGLCETACPTASLDGALIDADRCLTWLNEGSQPFPDWVSASWHNAIIGCTRCQYICPVNAPFLTDMPVVSLSESDTRALLNGDSRMIGITDTPSAVIMRNIQALISE